MKYSNYLKFNYLSLQECEYCRKPLLFDQLEARTRANTSNCGPIDPICQIPNCPQLVAAAN